LLAEFTKLGIKFEQATWDDAKKKEGKPKKRALTVADIEALQPFHWGYEFDEIINQRGGFDAIITNPPWEIFKPIAKEFCYDFDPEVERRGMDIKDFEERLAKLLRDPAVRIKYLEYKSQFPFVSAYYRSVPQFKNQISLVNDKRVATDINLYKLFVEQCFNLLRGGGYCGIVIPSGIYSDLGTKQLREMLFQQTQITGLFCFENRRGVFEGVDSRFKFVVLTFEKLSPPSNGVPFPSSRVPSPLRGEGQGGGESMANTPHPNLPPQGGKGTISFPAAFMRHDVAELEYFPKQGALPLSVDLIRRLSPDSLSVMEFKNETDVQIAKKMLHFPLLGEKIEGIWNLELTNEFHMTNDSRLFEAKPARGRLPLYEGKMIGHFSHNLAEPRYWINEEEGRVKLLGRKADIGQTLDYELYRLAYRSITSSTNQRTMICSILPKQTFYGHSLNATKRAGNLLSDPELVYLTAFMSSFVIDFSLRQRVATQLTMFYVYQLPVPRLTEQDPAFAPIVNRAAKLICTAQEFDDLAQDVGLKSHKNGVTDPVERAKLRAELDGLIAHLYGLTEEEFAYILTTFPLVPEPVKVAAQNAYRDVERGLIK
jgi:hypothetical protein